MKVIILCGGQGTRIRDVTQDIPKPMIPVGQYPIVWHIMGYYASYGHRDFVLCLGHLGHKIKEFFLNLQAYTHDLTLDIGAGSTVFHGSDLSVDWRVTLADTGQNAMTGARVKRVEEYLEGEENFLLTYGDGLSDVDLDALVDFHNSHGKIMTVTGVRPPSRFGEIASDVDGVVREFNEKPQAIEGCISGGFFVLNRRIFGYLNDDEGLVLEREPMENLVSDGQMMLFRHSGFWQCMDTSRDFLLLNDMEKRGDCPWRRG
ncbi:MAG: glucose-1-phosphate cytidylyltransferase [Longimicrobiales bacterium]